MIGTLVSVVMTIKVEDDPDAPDGGPKRPGRPGLCVSGGADPAGRQGAIPLSAWSPPAWRWRWARSPSPVPWWQRARSCTASCPRSPGSSPKGMTILLALAMLVMMVLLPVQPGSVTLLCVLMILAGLALWLSLCHPGGRSGHAHHHQPAELHLRCGGRHRGHGPGRHPTGGGGRHCGGLRPSADPDHVRGR